MKTETQITINQSRLSLDEAYLQMAEVWAKRSKANRKQVGALLVKDKVIISDGYNGMPMGAENDVCEFIGEDGQIYTKPETLHAESNAITKLSRYGSMGCQGATLYITLSPCFPCSLLIIQAGITRVVYRDEYRDVSGIHNLRKYGIVVDQVK